MLLASTPESGEGQLVYESLGFIGGPSNGLVQDHIAVNAIGDMTVRIGSGIALDLDANGVPFALFQTSRSGKNGGAHQVIATVLGHIVVVEVGFESYPAVIVLIPHHPGTCTFPVIGFVTTRVSIAHEQAIAHFSSSSPFKILGEHHIKGELVFIVGRNTGPCDDSPVPGKFVLEQGYGHGL